MKTTSEERIAKILKENEKELLNAWIKEQLAALTFRVDLIDESELKNQSAEFLRLFLNAVQTKNLNDIETPEWEKVREMLTTLSRSRAEQGFTPTETTTFIFSLKQPLFSDLRRLYKDQPEVIAEDTWTMTTVLDKLGLYSSEAYMKSRESIITRQHQEILELATPVVQLWDSILAVPLIGTLDSARTQEVMETLLQRIVDTGTNIAIIDITGVPTVDTMVAQHLLKTVTAARLMGTDCIISGIRPQIAQTIVHLGVSLGDVTTKSTMAEALALAFKRLNLKVVSA